MENTGGELMVATSATSCNPQMLASHRQCSVILFPDAPEAF